MSIKVSYQPSNAAQAMAEKLDAKGLVPLDKAIGRLRKTAQQVEAELLAAFTAEESLAADRARIKAQRQRDRARTRLT